MITYIYEENFKQPVGLNYPIELFVTNPKTFYPKWSDKHRCSEVRYRYPILQEKDIREATRVELVIAGIVQLVPGEILVDGEITVIPKPDGCKIVWTGTEWIESATVEELEEYKFNESVKFYNEELEFASKATAELMCEIISPEMFEEVKYYMMAIDPYAPSTTRKTYSQLTRPQIFTKYTK